MKSFILKSLMFVLVLAACSSPRNSSQSSSNVPLNAETSDQPVISPELKPQSLMDLPQSQYGGFVLKPGFYEAEFKTYCLQPGTPDPRKGDAYLQGPISGYRKEIVESILLNSKGHQDMDQQNIQLLLWSVVSGSDFNNLAYTVQSDAHKLLTQKQIYQLKGGVWGAIKEVSYSTGLINANSEIRSLFEISERSYAAYENIAVRREEPKIIRKGVKKDQWYKQDENYYVRYFPQNYKKVKIQVYVPDGLLDADNKLNNDYLVFDPTGLQAIPAFTNAQRLGIGTSVIVDMARTVIKINKRPAPPKKAPSKTDNPKTDNPKT